MVPDKKNIIAQLRQDILRVQGYKPVENKSIIDLGPLLGAFPNGAFPLASLHEFISYSPESTAATGNFITGLLSQIGLASFIWISARPTLVFPPALKLFGLNPERVVFIEARGEKEVLWCAEEALGSKAVTSVIVETGELSFKQSRRLQLAVEKSGSTGFFLRQFPRKIEPNACAARWAIQPSPSIPVESDFPGVSHPSWTVELLHVKNGRPGKWSFAWSGGTIAPVQRNHHKPFTLAGNEKIAV